MKEFYKKKITNSDQAVSFIVNLHLENKLFHFADDAGDIKNSDGEKLFTDEESKEIDFRVNEVFQHIEDPFIYILLLQEPELLTIK